MTCDRRNYPKAITACGGERVWDKAIQSAEAILKNKSRVSELITYKTMAEEISSKVKFQNRQFWARDWRFHLLLGAISESSNKAYGFMLSALVVRKDTQRPGKSFYGLAKDPDPKGLGLRFDDEEQFWNEQCAKIFNHYAGG